MPGLKLIHNSKSGPLDFTHILPGYFSGTAASQSEAVKEKLC